MSGLFRMHGPVPRSEMSDITASIEATHASNQANQAQRSVKMLQEDLVRTMLICEALWELLKDRTGLTVDDLHKKLYELDMQDGQLDGKNQRKAVECPGCGRTVSSRHTTCLYCGQVIDDSVFRI